ncbi:uncharacterized protein LOC120115325 [Hibiscus syriacus]|uniref:uncharacterized protein LOC120115325 n=1 Tax=Hibiscus syriacus TaxID=106335 RepID=UPI001921EF20|nr:uncharacterized protein LOC120115325 [Hibiscus syriacus]
MEQRIQYEVEDNAVVLRWSGQSQIIKGNNLSPGYVSDLIGYTDINILGHVDISAVDLFERRRGHAPLMVSRQYGSRQFIPVTSGLSESDQRPSQEYERWIISQVNDKLPMVNIENVLPIQEHLRVIPSPLELARQDFEIEMEQWKRTLQKLEVEVYHKGIEIDIYKGRAYQVSKVEKHLILDFNDLQSSYQQMEALEQRLLENQAQNQKLKNKILRIETEVQSQESNLEAKSLRKQVNELEAKVQDLQRKENQLPIVPYEGILQWSYRWERAQWKVEQRDDLIAKYLEQAQGVVQYLVDLAYEATTLSEGLDPETKEAHKVFELLEHLQQLGEISQIILDTSKHPYNTRKRVMDDKITQIKKTQLEMQENFKKAQEEMYEQMLKSHNDIMKIFASMLQRRGMDQVNTSAVGTITEESLYPPGFTPRADCQKAQNMEKKINESFKHYAQRWRDIVVQVHPPMEEEETNILFVNTLKDPFFTHLIGNSFKSFADIVTVDFRALVQKMMDEKEMEFFKETPEEEEMYICASEGSSREKDRFGLGYQPTVKEKQRGIRKNQELRKEKLAGEDLIWEPMIFLPLSNTFVSGGHIFQEDQQNKRLIVENTLKEMSINVISDDESVEKKAIGIYPAPSDFELSNWTAEELLVVFKSFSE